MIGRKTKPQASKVRHRTLGHEIASVITGTYCRAAHLSDGDPPTATRNVDAPCIFLRPRIYFLDVGGILQLLRFAKAALRITHREHLAMDKPTHVRGPLIEYRLHLIVRDSGLLVCANLGV